MALDTRSRRASVIGLALAAQLTLPLADATVGQPDRQHVALCYPGIAASALSTTAMLADLRVTALATDVVVEVSVADYVIQAPSDDEVEEL